MPCQSEGQGPAPRRFIAKGGSAFSRRVKNDEHRQLHRYLYLSLFLFHAFSLSLFLRPRPLPSPPLFFFSLPFGSPFLAINFCLKVGVVSILRTLSEQTTTSSDGAQRLPTIFIDDEETFHQPGCVLRSALPMKESEAADGEGCSRRQHRHRCTPPPL